MRRLGKVLWLCGCLGAAAGCGDGAQGSNQASLPTQPAVGGEPAAPAFPATTTVDTISDAIPSEATAPDQGTAELATPASAPAAGAPSVPPDGSAAPPAGAVPTTSAVPPASAAPPASASPPPDPVGSETLRFVVLQQDWEAKGCSSAGLCHDLDERTIVVKISPDPDRLFLNWAQIAPLEAGGEGVAAAASVEHFASLDSYPLWLAWQAAGYPFVE